ncbi:DNAJ protein JJJ1 homolog [Zingiber officinale]|uniref:Uncharacterized protein n=1 Tax=Zingiber officinale TaxID=94328 RepID=A0A8J5F7K0_ZINOF|nr:DNAJ protein JJJ1 homolog [Zingiber officinale]KAG6484514.1 hypothetical protein ZIOFF_053032 [Zingiber officinale]
MATQPQRRCLYEVLGVPRDCSQEEIRSAYRRLALQRHPDKVAASGAADAASATAAFQELLHAYEILSDPKERAWYDSHRSQVLFSDPSASKGHKPSAFFDLDLFDFFSNSAFSGYSDNGKGFYKVYGDLFAKVYGQEAWFAKQMDLGASALAPAPLIGNLDSPYSQVTAFYNYWLGFSTVMDFGWVDEYDSSIGPNRRSRRAMEEENKKLRKKARREYNDTVRGLAAFAKKRDKRVVDMTIKKNLEEEKRREEEKARKKEEERKKMERAKLYQEPEWAKVNVEEEVFDGFEDENDKKKNVVEEFYCVVCNKKFKSDKQWKNHEQSKKHKDKVAELRMTFEEDEEIVEQEDNPRESEESDVFEEIAENFEDDLELSENEEEAGHPGDIELQEDNNEEEHAKEGDDEANILEAMVTGRKNRKNDYFNRYDLLLNNNPNNVKQRSMEFGSQKSGPKNSTSTQGNNEAASEVKERDDVSREETDVQNQESSPLLNDESPHSPNDTSAASRKDLSARKNKKSKKQQADGKGTGKNASPPDSNNLSRGKKQKAKTSKALSNECETCGQCFATRNKLSAHLGDTGHAFLKYK